MFCGGRCNILLLSLLAWLALEGGVARAQTSPHRRTVVLRLEFEGSVNEVSRDQLARRLFEGLASAGFQVFSADEVVARLYESTPQLKTCADETCYRQIAAALQANYLVIGKVDAKRRDYRITLSLIEGRTGKVLRSGDERCDVCGIQEAGDTVNMAAAALRAGLDEIEAPAQITVETTPPGALVEADGQPLGFTPLTHELTVGVHSIVISKAGYDPVIRSMEVFAGAAEAIALDLKRQPGPFLSAGWKAVGWVSVAAGVAAMAVGGVLMSDQGKLNTSDCSGGRCGTRYENRLLASAFLAGGGLMAGFGSVVVFVAPGVVSRSASQGAGASIAHSAQWQVVLRGNF